MFDHIFVDCASVFNSLRTFRENYLKNHIPIGELVVSFDYERLVNEYPNAAITAFVFEDVKKKRKNKPEQRYFIDMLTRLGINVSCHKRRDLPFCKHLGRNIVSLDYEIEKASRGVGGTIGVVSHSFDVLLAHDKLLYWKDKVSPDNNYSSVENLADSFVLYKGR
jgi:hypothetical protein